MTDGPVLLCSMLLATSAAYIRARPLRRQFLGLDKCTVSRTHHDGIVQDGFTALKAPSRCPPCGHPRWLWGVPVMWSIPQDASWGHGDLPSCPAHSPLHPPIPWSPHPRGAHRTFLPLPRPCCSLRSKKHTVWGAGPWKPARWEGTFSKTKSALRRSTQGVMGPGAPSPGDHAHSPRQEASPGALWVLRGQRISEVALPTGRLVPLGTVLVVSMGGWRPDLLRAPLCTEGPPGHKQLACTPAVPGGSPRVRARDTGGCRALYPENAEPSTTNSKKTNAPNENDLHSPFSEEGLQTHGKMLTIVSDQGKLRQATGGTTSLPVGGRKGGDAQ
uniref:Uncharacterized protein LOC109547612 n=1 Tax=Tursiops truncatus TaxID=9739 RepID=A0A2U4A6Z2_TURTR|nr:uncharacterized protein LOC109547612 [Tursiops truncatus]XP_033699398.1 uncharacterized protein LOC109547612 [Tursiops truncatus]